MQPPTAHDWHAEYVRRVDAETGVQITQLTSAPLIHETLDTGGAVFTPDSRFLLHSRRLAPDLPRELWLADLATFSLRRLTDEAGAIAPALTPDGKWLVYVVVDGEVALRRLCLATLERETLGTTDALCEVADFGSVRFDGRFYAVAGSASDGAWAVVRFDLTTGDARVVVKGPELRSARPQYTPALSGDLLIQVSPGATGAALPAGYGPCLEVIADDGTNPREVHLGRSDMEMIQGHHCWAADTGYVLSTLLRRETPDQAFRSDRVVVAEPASGRREDLAMGRAFAHPCASRDGHWWVCDDSETGCLHVGSLHAHSHCLLVHTGASLGAPRYTRPHPAMSPDGSCVAYTSDATGVPQLYVAYVPAGMMQRLI